ACEGLVLPGPRALLLVVLEGGQGGDEQAARARRAQPEVGLEERARGRAQRQPVVVALREARVVLGGALVRVVVDEDEVEVGRIAELLAPELAVSDHGETRLFAVRLREVAPARGKRAGENTIGELRQVVGEALYREQAREVLREEPKELRLVLLA